MLNYNARDYNPATHTIPKTTGQLFDEDLVLNAGVTAYTSTSLSIDGQYMGYTFQSTGSNIFNRSGQDSLTIVAKTSKGLDNSGEHSIFSNRGSGLNYILFNPANGADKTIVFLHNSQRLYNNCPYVQLSADTNIYAIRVEGGSGYGQSYTDEQTFATVTNSWGGGSNKIGFFYDSAGQGGLEGWRGEFYWLYISNEALTTKEIERVIAYNENRLSVEPDTIAATSGGSAYTVNVDADTGVSWTASSENTWINLSPTTGMGNGAITVNIPANPTYEERSGEIALLSSDEGDITIPVYQAKKAAILTRHQMYRNGEVINKAYRGGELVYLNIISPEPVYSAMPLTFEIISGGTISWYNHYGNAYTNKTIYYSKDNGITWSGITSSSSTGSVPSISVSAGESILFKGNSETYGQILSDRHYYTFSGSTAYFNLKGNIMSMIYGDDYLNNTVLTNKSNFYGMFYSTNVVDCTNLILPTMSLTNSCYSRMFNNCASLTGAPKLPATTLADSCYGYMFTNCTNLTTAPELKQEVLTDNCYNGMFWGCTNLNYIKCLATDISASDCVNTWTYLVQTTSGTFVKAASMSGWTRDSNGIPVNWTVENA